MEARPVCGGAGDAGNETVDGLVQRAPTALGRFEAFDQEQVAHIVKKASPAALGQHGELARLAAEETGRGLFEDKAVKNLFACEHVVNSMRGPKTAGVIRRDELNGITEIAEPVGAVCAMTPVANPDSTTVFKALIALKTRNPIIFAFSPRSAARPRRPGSSGTPLSRPAPPADCVQGVEQPSMEATGALMNHPGVSTVLATGGNAMVKAAYCVAHGRAGALLLPHVIRHNGTVWHKATPWPKAGVHRAPERCQEIARMLGLPACLPAATPAEGVESYARAVEELHAWCGIPASFAEEGVGGQAFPEALPAQAVNAYADRARRPPDTRSPGTQGPARAHGNSLAGFPCTPS
ncbi:iron-containing alcohol dehydrogenase [Streptomyces sp. NPDC059355]|uniref:aldehyde dehydrogenase family protein n=1 Tax=Streptomyces sp. NPDC059355 TaxID=3346811 RepID=UPI0036AF2FF9